MEVTELNAVNVKKVPDYGGSRNVENALDAGNPIIGYYKDGAAIHKHASAREIEEHIEEWWELSQKLMSKEQWETVDEMRNWQINTHFQRHCEKNKLNDEAIIETSIKWWTAQWPWEVKPFFSNVTLMKNRLFNEKGYAQDKHAEQVLYGMVPDKVKQLCLAARRDFWQRNHKGRCPNLELFYQLCPKAKISTLKGSA